MGQGLELNSAGERNDISVRTVEMCAGARRVIGFTPIELRMLDLKMQRYGADNMDEVKLMEINSYLNCEMKMRCYDIEKLDIVNIFPPAKENWNVMYVMMSLAVIGR